MKHLTSISILLLLLASCKVQSPSVKKELPVPFILNAGKSLVYRASFDYKDYHFSGLCVFKKTAESTVRVVFMNEMGITFMDFELAPGKMIVHKMMEQLDKKILLGFIEKDFRQLLMTDLFDPKKVHQKAKDDFVELRVKNDLKASYFRDRSREEIERSVRRGVLGIKGVTVKYMYDKNAVPSEIILDHRRVEMNLKLTLLEKI